jgi:hypothetical protein
MVLKIRTPQRWCGMPKERTGLPQPKTILDRHGMQCTLDPAHDKWAKVGTLGSYRHGETPRRMTLNELCRPSRTSITIAREQVVSRPPFWYHVLRNICRLPPFSNLLKKKFLVCGH